MHKHHSPANQTKLNDHKAVVGNGGFAASAVATWRAIDLYLSTIIGQRGFTTLLQRSIQRTCQSTPSLVIILDDSMQPGDYEPLLELLSEMQVAEAAATNDALLQNFYRLLAKLLGISLTERLLRSVSSKSTGEYQRRTPSSDQSKSGFVTDLAFLV